ncbi:MAG: PliI family lysozyme inhibitor of I-type lysozyme, partial [Cyanobium sp.]
PHLPITMNASRILPRLAPVLLSSLFASGAWAAGAFNKTLSLQGYSFQVQASGAGSQQQLTITTKGGKPPIQPIRQTVDGQVVGAEVADLDGNGKPDILVYVQSAGSGSYGQVVGYSVIGGSSLSPITLPELSGPLAQGYRGHDEFQVVEGCLARRFPIYKTGDSNAKATGGLRQICYKIKAGEAGWILKPTSVLKF